MATSITRMNPPSLPDAGAIGYSQISTTEPGRLAFISGQVAWRPNGEEVPDDLATQAEIVTDNARKALEAVGATSEDIVIARVYMIDLTPDRQEIVMQSLIKFFGGVKPSLTGLGVAELGGPGLQLELELVVRLPS